MHAMWRSLAEAIDDVHVEQMEDGGIRFSRGECDVTFHALEAAQVERGLVPPECVRACLLSIFCIGQMVASEIRSALSDPTEGWWKRVEPSRN